MENFPHLRLTRVEYTVPRRKRASWPPRYPRNHKTHAQDLINLVGTIEEEFEANQTNQPSQFDPALIFCIHLDRPVEEYQWRSVGLKVLSIEPNKAAIVFSDTNQLDTFREKITSYGGDIPEGQKNPSQNWIASIRSMEKWGPQHRKGPKLHKLEILPEELYILDVEIWYFDTRDACQNRLNQLRRFIIVTGHNYYDQFIGDSICLARVQVSGTVLEELLLADPVASIDLPPQPHISISSVFQKSIDDFPPVPHPPENSPGICIIDTGLERGHPILGPAVGDTDAVPKSIGSSLDSSGHGTMVGGVALYGDITKNLEIGSFEPELNLFSVRVTNDEGRFDDERLIVTQMVEAIETIHQGYGCRVFNISLGDDENIFTDDQKPAYWATILDELVRKYDIIIVVSVGNYLPYIDSNDPEAIIREYPNQLFGEDARLIDPATGVNVITVGSLTPERATYAAERSITKNDPSYIPIAQTNQPSPFTRRGLGVENAIKPDLCEYGGNLVYDGRLRRIYTNDPGAGIVSTYHDFGQGRLFGFRYGTSFAAPRVAHQAAQILKYYPQSSSNLVRALLAASAEIPQETKELIGFQTSEQKRQAIQLCGYGKPDISQAIYSTNYRVTLTREDSLQVDHFHVYEVPIPDEYKETRGHRRIGVTLAFDPPVRRTRRDYIGHRMSFRLIRGMPLAQVIEFYKDRKGQDLSVAPPTNTQLSSKMWPGYDLRHPGTLQKSVLDIKAKTALDYETPFWLVVWCEGRWAKDEDDYQRYAIVVTLEHVDNQDINIYNVIQEQLDLPITTRLQI